MSIRINYINSNGAGFGESLEVSDGVTIAAFFMSKFPGANPRDYVIRVNNSTVTAHYALRQGDGVSIICNVQGATASAPQPVQVPGIAIRFIDNGAGGFADSVRVASGTSLADFLQDRNVAVKDVVIRVNGDIAVAGYVLRPDDAVVVAPSKIQGAANIRVCLVCNDGTGFADYVDIADGSTLRDLVAAKTNLGDPKNYNITLNGAVVTLGGQFLHNGDRISITPIKIQGA